MTVRAVIVEDEPEAVRLLQHLVRDVDWLELAGCATDGRSALDIIERTRPELLFLDVHLPELSGIDLLSRLRHQPRVVFTTAYDEYAITALQAGALDYLVKPFGRERFHEALRRVHRRLDELCAVPQSDRLRCVLDARVLTRVFVRVGERIVPVALCDVRRIEAADDYVRLHARGGSYLAHIPLSELERRLDATRFLRIHRSHVVNLDCVVSIHGRDERRLEVILDDGTRLTASRSGSQALRRLVL